MAEVKVKETTNDGLAEFLIGLILGIASGGILALLFAPRSGAETQRNVQRFISDLPNQVRDDIQNPEGKTRSFLDKTIINIENQVGKVNRAIRAGRMAEAKRREEKSSDYDYDLTPQMGEAYLDSQSN
jgi:gas vesicle protein